MSGIHQDDEGVRPSSDDDEGVRPSSDGGAIEGHASHAATQAFDYYGQHWDIFTAQWLVTGRQPQLLEIDEALKEFTRTVTVDTERALATADLSQPVLVIPLPPEIFGPDAGDLVIDGYHRITRAIHETQTGLPAHFLTAGDERETRRGDTWDSLAPHIPWHASRRSTPEVSSD